MPLSPGTRLGPYDVTALIGWGWHEGSVSSQTNDTQRPSQTCPGVHAPPRRAPAASGLGIAFVSLGEGASTRQMAK